MFIEILIQGFKSQQIPLLLHQQHIIHPQFSLHCVCQHPLWFSAVCGAKEKPNIQSCWSLSSFAHFQISVCENPVPPAVLFVASTCQQVRLSLLIKTDVPIRAVPSSPRRSYCLRRWCVFSVLDIYLFVLEHGEGERAVVCLKNTLCPGLYDNLSQRSLPKAIHKRCNSSYVVMQSTQGKEERAYLRHAARQRGARGPDVLGS